VDPQDPGRRDADVPSEGETRVAVHGVGKRFGGVQALRDVSLEIRRGEIHALVGENGAGKSTLGRIISGAVAPDEGELVVRGRRRSYRSPRDALQDGVATVTQELVLLPKRPVIENVLLGVQGGAGHLLNRRALRARYEELSGRVGFEIDPDARVGALPVAEQQKVAILRALARDADLLILDEPTAALTRDEATRLLEIGRALNRSGTTIVYVSHFLEEVLAFADRVTVLKDGRLIRTAPASEETVESLVASMLGRSLELTFPAKREPPPDAPVVLSVRGLAREGVIAGVDLDVRAGEIVGLAGLVGSGRSEVARAIFGADHRDRGVIEIDGTPQAIRSPRQGMRHGIALVPESRKDQGLFLGRAVVENVSLPHLATFSAAGVLQTRGERSTVGSLLSSVGVRTDRARAPVATLSGGNQQKVLFARWLLRRPKVLIADEPTKGVDVGAKLAIYELLHGLAADGMGVLLISSELEEVLGLAHRVLVMRRGRIVSRLDGADIDEGRVMDAAFGAGGPSALEDVA
jgi:ribose transport system ATP-binding protein